VKLAMSHTDAHNPAGQRIEATGVARRSLILSGLICRGSIDDGAGQADAEELRSRILEWLTASGLWEEAEPYERSLLHAPLGSLCPKDVFRTTWYTEGLAILAWALNRLELPRHDKKVDPYVVTDALGFLNEDAAGIIRQPELRRRAELEACREMYYAIHSRLRDFNRNKEHKDFTKWIEQSWLATLNVDREHLITDSDLARQYRTWRSGK